MKEISEGQLKDVARYYAGLFRTHDDAKYNSDKRLEQAMFSKISAINLVLKKLNLLEEVRVLTHSKEVRELSTMERLQRHMDIHGAEHYRNLVQPKTYRVEYYYLATGMEGIPDHRIEGRIIAANPEQAIDEILRRNYSNYSEQDQRWIRGCLSAHEER